MILLFSEQVRWIRDEEELVKDTAIYESPLAEHDWTLRVSKSITLTAEKIVCVRFDARVKSITTAWVCGAARVLLGGAPLISSGGMEAYNATVLRTRTIFLILPAGSYTFDFQSSAWHGGANVTAGVTNIYIGGFNFPDKNGVSHDSGLVSAAATATTTMINRDITIPATRRLAVGPIKKYMVYITAYMERDAQRVSKVKNIGEADEASFFNWKILINDIQRNWLDRADDHLPRDVSDLTFAEGAYGKLAIPLDPGSTFNLKINVYNGFTTAYSGRALVRVLVCPWLLGDVLHEPVALDFPQGSTLYVILEPLDLDPTKHVKIGMKRGISFGDATDYYSTASGTGILIHSYTFEVVDVSKSLLLVGGLGGCVSALGVDVR